MLVTRSVLTGALAVLVVAAGAAASVLENVAYSATAAGTLPSVTLDQGGLTPTGIYDGSMFAWFGGASSPRRFTDTNLQPYMTWSTDQTVRTTRVWFDTTNTTPSRFDRIAIDTLKLGGSATTEADWEPRVDTGTGLANAYVDLDLGADVTTRGLRVRAFKTNQDINVGEVAVFKPLLKPGTLSANRIAPTGASDSSDSFGQGPAFANDAFSGPSNRDTNTGWYGRWLSDLPAANPGTTFTLDVNLPPASVVNGVSVTFGPQSGFSAVPSQYTLLADRGSGFVSLGTFSTTGSRLMYYNDLGFGLNGVNALRLAVNESDVPGGLRVAVFEFEAFNLPEPGTAAFLVVGGMLALKRRTTRGIATSVAVETHRH